MISYFDYSDLIGKTDCLRARDKIDSLIDSGNWCQDVPKYQTYPNLHTYEEFQIFTSTFINACEQYVKLTKLSFEYGSLKMWALKLDEKSEMRDSWHSHGNEMDISGIYYLDNQEQLCTRFMDEKENIVEYSAKPYNWLLFQSSQLHAPPSACKIKRYVIAADIFAKT